MAEQVEQVTYKFVWDTSGVDQGAAHIERAYDREKKARERSQSNNNGSGNGAAPGSSAHSGSYVARGGASSTRGAGDAINIATGSSGNVMRLNALTHFGAPTALAGAALAAGAVGKKLVEQIRGEIMKSAEQSAKLSGSFMSTAGRGQFAGIGSGTSALGSLIGDATSGLGSEASLGDELRRQRAIGGVNGGVRSIFDATGRLFGRDGIDDQIRSSDYRGRVLGIQAGRLQGDRVRRFGAEADIAGMRLGGGSEFGARGAELGLQEQAEIEAARAAGAGPEALAAISRKYGHLRTGNALDARAERRGTGLLSEAAYIRGRGQDTASRLAYSQFQAADDAFQNAPNEEARARARAERNGTWQSYLEADRSERSRKAGDASALGVASFRGGSEARTLNEAQAALDLEKRRLDIAKEAGEEATREQTVRVAQAELALNLTKQQVAVQRIAGNAALTQGAISVGALQFAAGQSGQFSSSNPARFMAGLNIAGNNARAGVSSAEAHQRSIWDKMEAEGRTASGISDSTRREEIAATQELEKARAEETRTTKQSAAAARDFSRQWEANVLSQRNTTAVMRIANTGRADHAAIFAGRAHSQAEALALSFEGRGDEAAEVLAQQGEAETGAFLNKFYKSNGRRRRKGPIMRAEHAATRAAHRLARAAGRFQGSLGLDHIHRGMDGRILGGVDALTRDPTSADQVFARKHAAAAQAAPELRETNKLLQEIRNFAANIPKATW